MGAGRRAFIGLAWLSGAVAGGCTDTKTRGINTDRLLTEFNSGAVDSAPDPALCASDIAIERVALTAKRSLVRGFNSQGSCQGPTVASWMRDPSVRELVRILVQARRKKDHEVARVRVECHHPEPPPVSPVELPADFVQSPDLPGDEPLLDDRVTRPFRARFYAALTSGVAAPARLPSGRACGGAWPTREGKLYADAGKLDAALELMALDVAQLIDEEVVGFDDAMHGVDRALDEAADYLVARRWQPAVDAPTAAISIKGGASSGVYSAGVTWRVLTMLEHYRTWRRDHPDHPGIPAEAARFELASGTSAGAIVAAAVDLFHQDACVIDRAATEIRQHPGLPRPVPPVGEVVPATGEVCQTYARSVLATVFTCVDQGSLYCVDSRPIWEVAGKQRGIMEFDGLRKLVARYVGPLAPVNRTELVLTTVDFRWGELYVQSDQDPAAVYQPPLHALATPATLDDVHASIEASFVLPFIAWPVDDLRIAGMKRPGVFLDGGIKSEIPVLSLVQRGAERTLVVGSAPPRITPTEAQKSGLDIAARYLDVSLSAVTESEWNAAVPVARHTERFERKACESLLVRANVTPVDASAFCAGDLSGGCGGRKLDRTFDRFGIFRREDIDPSIGYTFDPAQMRRLFDAGAAAARMNCQELAAFLGLGPVPPSVLDEWCNETPHVEPGLCADAKEEYRTCDFEPESARKSPR